MLLAKPYISAHYLRYWKASFFENNALCFQRLFLYGFSLATAAIASYIIKESAQSYLWNSDSSDFVHTVNFFGSHTGKVNRSFVVGMVYSSVSLFTYILAKVTVSMDEEKLK